MVERKHRTIAPVTTPAGARAEGPRGRGCATFEGSETSLHRPYRPSTVTGVSVRRSTAKESLVARLLLAPAILLLGLGPMAVPAFAADSNAPTMEARVLLGGHARVGSWMAVEVHLTNDGPSVTGELRLDGG